MKRIMVKASYPIHTEAVRQHLIPPKIVRTKQEGLYFATHEQLLVLSLLQGLNAKLMEWGSDAHQRLDLLNEAAIDWMEVMLRSDGLKELPDRQKSIQ